jgi:Tripartite tricarboxylate transporter TctB family
LNLKIRNAKDLFAGLLFVVFGAAAVLIGRHYPLGSASRMGPGYFPVLVGALLVLVGVVVTVRALVAHPDRIGRIAVKPLVLVLAAVATFAAFIEQMGLAVVVLSVVVVGYLANPRPKWLELVVLAAVLTGASLAIFVYGLKLPFKVWPDLNWPA